MILPLITGGLVGLHLLLVQKAGMSTPKHLPPQNLSHMKFFPNFFLRELMVWYGVLALLGSLAAIFPWELGEKADPFASAPAGIRPEWYFLAQFYTLKLIPSHVWIFEGELLGLAGFGLLALVWVALPFWATTRPDGSGRARVATGVGIFLVCYLFTFTLLGYFK
jgi:cytochrome b6